MEGRWRGVGWAMESWLYEMVATTLGGVGSCARARVQPRTSFMSTSIWCSVGGRSGGQKLGGGGGSE